MMYDYKLVDHTVGETKVAGDVNEVTEGVGLIGASTLWNEGFEGEGIVVAVLDTGVKADHHDLQGQIIGGYNFTDDYNGDTTNYTDGHGHGTHVSGTIAAASNGAGVVGVAPKAKILALKVLNNQGSGAWTWCIDAINYAIAWRGPNGEKVNIISLSLGGPTLDFELFDAIDRADAAGILIVCAAGNEGDGNGDTTEVSYPAYFPQCVCVGAFNGWGGVAYYSNSNNQVDVIALGSSVLSTYNDGDYVYMTGTSMATPHVSGAAALVWSKLKTILDREVTAKDVWDYVVNKCTGLLPNYTKTQQGNGLVIMSETTQIDVDDVNFEDALAWFGGNHPRPVVNSVDYWRSNAVAGGTVNGEYAQGFIKKTYIVHGLRMSVKGN